MSEKANPGDISGGLKKFVPFLVFRGKTVERKLGITAIRTSLGRDPSCDIVFDEPGIGPRWGAIIRGRDSDQIFVQHEGGGPMPLEVGEAVAVGSRTLVRADFGTDLGRLWKTVEPGNDVQFDPQKPLFKEIFILADADMGSGNRTEAAPGGEVPGRLQTYPCEKRLSDKAQDVLETISRSCARAAADATLLPDADPPLRALERLSYAEVVAVFEELGLRRSDKGVPELLTFFQRFLLAEPVQAYRLRALLMAKYAAEVRGSGDKAQFPDLHVNWPLFLPSDVVSKMFDITGAVARLVDEGIW
jgi:hypothetical protein